MLGLRDERAPQRPATCGEGGERRFRLTGDDRRASHIVTFHTPLTKEGRFATRHLAGEDFFRKLQRKPWFVNASRGAVHDTDALLHARKEGKISELILDCWENEPDINRELLELATIATPHIAGFSADGKSQWYAYVSEKHRKILPSEDREDQRSDSASSRNSGYRLESV